MTVAESQKTMSAESIGLLDAVVLDGRGGGERLTWEQLSEWRPQDGLLWINLDYAAADAAHWLVAQAGLSQIAVETLTDRDPRPGLTLDGDEASLIVRGINVNRGAEAADMVSLRTCIEPNRVITMRHRPMQLLRSLADDLQRGVGPSTINEFAVAIIERVLPPVIALVTALDEEVAAGEEDLLDSQTAAGLRTRLSAVRRKAIALRRFIGPQRETFAAIAGAQVPWLDDSNHAELRLAASRLTRTVEELDALRDRAAVCAEELNSRSNDLANKRLYILSIMTALFLPLGFVCGLLGVNVGGVPFTSEPWAFWVLSASFLVAVVVQLWIFRRRGWF